MWVYRKITTAIVTLGHRVTGIDWS